MSLTTKNTGGKNLDCFPMQRSDLLFSLYGRMACSGWCVRLGQVSQIPKNRLVIWGFGVGGRVHSSNMADYDFKIEYAKVRPSYTTRVRFAQIQSSRSTCRASKEKILKGCCLSIFALSSLTTFRSYTHNLHRRDEDRQNGSV